MQIVSSGQRLKFTDIGLADTKFTITLEIPRAGIAIDSACFSLKAARKLDGERYMTFFNQPETPCGAVCLDESGRFEFDLGRLTASVDALILTLAIDCAGAMSGLGRSYASVVFNGQPVARFEFAGDLISGERAVMLLEIYRKDGLWRMSPVGQGFNGGLDVLVEHFGRDVAPPIPAIATPSAVSKVSLEKLDELPGRLMDNAGFFSVERPDEHPDDALFDLLMDEYPDWVKLARGHTMIL